MNNSLASRAKKKRKPVEWNGKIFESAVALGKHLRMDHPNIASRYAKNNKPLKGFIPKYIEVQK